MLPAAHVLLLPDVVFLIFEKLSTSERCEARLVCRTWNGVYVSLKGTLVVWSPTTLDGDGIVRDLEESLAKSPAPLTAVDLRLPDYPLGLNNEQRHLLESDLSQLFDKALSSLLECQTRRQYGFRLTRLRIGGWMECLLTPLPRLLSRFTRTRSLETLELLVPHAGSIDLMAILHALPQLRTIHLAAMDVSSWLCCTIEMAEDPSTNDNDVQGHQKWHPYHFQLEQLLVSNFVIDIQIMLKILERCPKLETLQLVGSLTGSWGVSGKGVFAAHCARLRYLHITPAVRENKIVPIARNFQEVIVQLPNLKRLGVVYQSTWQEARNHITPKGLLLQREDTLAVIQETMTNLTWLYLAEPSWTKPVANESILPFLHDMPHLEYLYAPFSFVDMDQLAITKKHRRHVDPWVAHRLKVLDLGFMNALYGNTSWVHGEHHPNLRTRDIFEFVGRAMPNLVHLKLRLFTGITLHPDGGMHYLGWLEKLETLVIVTRMVAAPVQEWKIGMFEWLGRPATALPEPSSVFYTGARRPKSKVAIKVKSWLSQSKHDLIPDTENQARVAFTIGCPYDYDDTVALPNLKRLHVQRVEGFPGGVPSRDIDEEMFEVEKYLSELRKGVINLTVEGKPNWDRSNIIFHNTAGNVIFRRGYYDE